MSKTHSEGTPESVIIAGAGPVGLLLACELGSRGIPVTVLEPQSELLRHPKANNFAARTMEIFRKQGISRTIRDQGGLPRNRATDIGYFTTMTGRELHRIPWASPDEAQRNPDPLWPTPEPTFRTTQMVVEPALLAHARTYPSVTIHFNFGLVDFEQDAEGVTVTAKHSATGKTETLRALYLVGCDGGRSRVREILGIELAGEGGLNQQFMGGPMQATYLRAPTLLSIFPHGDTWMNWTMSPRGRGIVVLINPEKSEFLVHFQLAPKETADADSFDKHFEAIVGQRIPYEIISTSPWRAGLGLVAEHYRQGRCFLAGDALHLFTPTGGMGVNTGIDDAFNLGWKLAMVCKGIAAPTLLDSYEIERRPIGKRNTGFALRFARNAGGCPISEHLCEDGPAGDAARAETAAYLEKYMRFEFVTPGFQFGARYDGSPIVIGDDGIPPADEPNLYIPSGVPGGRLPHVWLRDGTSLFDNLGREFTLICLGSGEDPSAWETTAAELLGGISVLRLSNELELHELIGGNAVLVRPDQHIAWRGSLANADPHEILATVSGGKVAVTTPAE